MDTVIYSVLFILSLIISVIFFSNFITAGLVYFKEKDV